MRILFITQSFPPELGALPSRMYPFVQELARAGHEVFVSTGMPNYPKGIVFDDYRGRWFTRERVDGYTVLRSAYYCVPRNISRWRQLLSYVSFIPAVFFSGLRSGEVDVVFVSSPPIFPAIAGIAIAKLHSAKLVFDIRDLWPDEIVACGGAREGSLAVRTIRRIERLIYRWADCITCTTPAFVETVRQRRQNHRNIVYLPNGADLELFVPGPAQQNAVPLPSGKFVVLFSGILGIKQGLDTLLLAAKVLEDQSDIIFHLIGTGSREGHVTERIAALNLTNVILAGEKKLNEVAAMIRRADVCVSLLMPDPYLKKIVSVKIYEYLACGRPVIGAHEGESARVIRQSGAGLVVPPGDCNALAEAIRQLRDHPELRQEFGLRGREWIEQHHSRRRIAHELEQFFLRLLATGDATHEPLKIQEVASTAEPAASNERMAA